MISSELILKVIESTIEGEKYEEKLTHQIRFLIEKEGEHTGIGLFIYFSYNDGIDRFRLTKSELLETFGEHNNQLDKFELINNSKNILADLTVHFDEGLIDCVEIWNKIGPYPITELTDFELRRF